MFPHRTCALLSVSTRRSAFALPFVQTRQRWRGNPISHDVIGSTPCFYFKRERRRRAELQLSSQWGRKKKNPTVNHDNIQLPACKVWLWDNLGLWRGRKVCVCLYRDCLLRKIWWLPSKYRRMVISFLFVLETGHQSEICKTRVNKWKACISRGGYNLSCKPRHL